MRRKAISAGILALGLTLVAIVPHYGRISTSGQSFKEYFQDLDQAGNSLNPVERFLFSLVLANSETAEARK